MLTLWTEGRDQNLLHVPPELSLISRQKQPWSNPTATWRAEKGEVWSSPHAGTRPSSGLFAVGPTRRKTSSAAAWPASAPGHLPGWGQRRRHGGPPHLPKSRRHTVHLTTPGMSGRALLFCWSSSLLHSYGDAGQVSTSHPRRWDVSCSTKPAFPPPNTVSVPCKPLGPFNQELKLWLNSSYPSPPGPTAGKIFCPGFLQPESDHLPLSRAEPSTQQSRTEKQPSSGCPWRSGYMSADQLLRTAVSLLRQRSKTQHRQN